ncbi:MAG TPA: SH3 domain-containing protein, partial [Victivallales bacterium]|nr:SH3 domain-containing protein [Victivallales bacterium]
VFIIIAIFAIGIAIFAAMQQFSGDYSKTLAIIRSQAANIHVLPSDSSEKIKIILRGGEKVKIVEERSDWIRIRINSNEGWIRNNNIKKIWN